MGGDHPPWDRLAAWQRPEPRRGPYHDAEPAAADIPAIDADVDSGELIAAQLPQILVMHDASHGSQVRSCSGEPPRGDQYLGGVRTLTTTASARAALDDHRGGETVRRGISPHLPIPQRGRRAAGLTSAPEMSYTTLTVPGMNGLPSRYDVTLRVASDDGRQPDPAAFAAVASQAASRGNASVVSAHTAGEVICLSALPRQTDRQRLPSPWPSSPKRSRLRVGSGHPAGERPAAAVVWRLEEHRLPELVMAAVAGDADVSHAAAARGGFPGRPQMHGFQLT